jgi:hypothetical protein
MAGSPHKNLLPFFLLALTAVCMGCAAPSIPVRFTAIQPPVLEVTSGRNMANLGFNGDDLTLNDRVGFLITQRLRADTTITVIEPRKILRVLSRYTYTAGQISDSLVLDAGRALDADLVLIGDLEKVYTEQYGEEKKYRMQESFTPSGYRLIDRPYYEPFIDQAATMTATLRAIQVPSGHIINEKFVRVSDTLHIVLPTRLEKPPEGIIPVENISPQLSDKIRTELITQLIATFAWHQVIVTREIYEKIKPDNEDIVALRGGDWARARAIWKQAVLDAPDNAAAWNNLGVAYEQALMPNEAQQAYARALALKPKDKMILRNSRGREGR